MTTLTQFTEALANSAWLILVLTGVGQLIKMTFPKIKRFISLIVAVIGIACGLAFVGLTPLGVIVGLAVGLASTGLYEIGSTAFAGK